MKKILILYNLLITGTITIFSFTTVSSNQDLALPILITPLVLYFAKEFFKPAKRYQRRLVRHPLPSSNTLKTIKEQQQLAETVDSEEVLDPEILGEAQVKDIDRRLFLKLIGSAGLTTFIFSLFTDKAHGAFFGSMPGPGVIGLKDSSGNAIDPAEKQPTDGYSISEVDETDATYNYYGFVEQGGAWYVSREEKSTGSFRYTKGASSFSTNWTGKAGLTYNYFDVIF